MKVTVVGGGSTYTPELVDGIARLTGGIKVTELVLADPDESRLSVVGPVSRRIMAAYDNPADVTWTTRLDEGLDGANGVLLQLRVGGQAARHRDETWPLDCGCIGQETTGAGGLAKALRTVPVVLDIAERARQRAAGDAWIIDFTNPVGIVTRALLDFGHRAIGLCNVAIGFQRQFAAFLGVEPDSVALDHAGLNHLTWERAAVVDGIDRLPDLIDAHGAELAERVGGQWIKVAASGDPAAAAAAGPELRLAARANLMLIASGQDRPLTDRLLHGYAAQAAAALDRDRLRTQAAQAEALAEGNRMRTALLAAVSHDLRTPLASIKASVSTLRQTDVSWEAADEAALLATIERSSDRLDALIGNLLDMSRLTAGSLQPFLRPTAIDEVAPVALRGLDAGTRMRLMVPDDLPLVRTDPGLLERVLANLFANALGYSPPGRDPELHARQDDGGVLLEIADHGRGVPDELKEQMFEPFQRLDGRGGGPGTPGGIGLGLAVVRGFLDIMGGSVEPADTPGGGLTMRVRLPAAVESADAGSLTVPQ